MKAPLISVCIPIFNGDKYLETCLNSVISQTYRDIEILLIDDHSSDQSKEIIKKFANNDTRVRYILNERNLGMVNNWKKCIDEAKGIWLKFLFQDDVMKLDCIERMLNESVANKVEFSICARDFIIEESASPQLKYFFEKNVFKLEKIFTNPLILKTDEILEISNGKLLINFIGEPIVTFFKKKLIEKIGNFKTGLPQLVDYEFLLRAILNTSVYFIPEKLVTFRVNGDSESDKQFSNIEKQIRIQLIEPMVMFHEYLFEKRLAKIRLRFGFYQLFRTSFSIYRSRAKYFDPIIRKENLKVLYPQFKYLFLIVAIAEFSLLIKPPKV